MSSACKKRRVTLKFKSPNALFEKWLKQWEIEYKEKGSKLQYCFSKALKSLKKYPLPLESGKDCGILEGFGSKLCVMLDQRLLEYKKSIENNQLNADTSKENGTEQVTNLMSSQVNSRPVISRCIQNSQETVNLINGPQKKTIRKTSKQYIPEYGSGPHAILLALLKINNEKNPRECTKQNVINVAQPLCDKSFVTSEPGSYYTAWSSMRTLILKGLVAKHGKPPIFELTDTGKKLSYQLSSNVSENFDNQNKICPDEIISVIDSEKTDSATLVIDLENIPTIINSNKLHNKNNNSDHDNIQKNISDSSKVQFDNENKLNNTIFEPNTFEIILLVDTQETSGKKKNSNYDATINELSKTGINFEVRHLNVGDFTWIARDGKNNELVLPYIIERKRMDDFGSSIKDGRFHEQKFRLKQCGIENLIYLVESHGNNQHTGLPLTTLYQAATNTLIQDKFSVKYTVSHKQSIAYITTVTRILCNIYQNKLLIGCTKNNITHSSIDSDCASLLIFTEFNKSAAKTKNFKVHDLFARHLVQIKGVSRDMALAIVDKYPTPKCLRDAYLNVDDISGEKLLSTIQYGQMKRYVGLVISKIVYNLYTKVDFSDM